MTEEEEENEENEENPDLAYDTVLMRDTCGNSRSKIRNYFYHRVYEPKNFKYVSYYDELILLDVLDGTKKKKDYLKTVIPFILIMCLGGLSIALWILLCFCYKAPKGCLKRYSKSNRRTRDSCFFLFFGFCSVILILIIITAVYLDFSTSDINGAVCTLSMLRYEIVYGQSLLDRQSFKKPYWYGIDTLSENIEKIKTLIVDLQQNCEDEIIDGIIDKNSDGENIFDETGNKLKEELETIYTTFKDRKISVNIEGSTHSIIPSYISNLGYKENNETYTGKIFQDYEIHYEYIAKKIFDPILEICKDFQLDADDDPSIIEDLPNALNQFNEVFSTLQDSMDFIALNVTKKISDELINLKNIYYVFYLIFLGLMAISIVSITILFFIYYYKPISAINYSIKVVLYIMNFLMIFCLVLSGLSGILYKYFRDSSDIVDCMFSEKNIGSDDPRIVPRTSGSSVLTRCIIGDGNLLDLYLTDNARKHILLLKKINTIYTKIIHAYNKIIIAKEHHEINEYSALSSLDEVIEEFELMKREFSLTTSKEEAGSADINYMLNELNKYTLSGMGYQTICDTSTYHLWSLRVNSGPTVQIDQEDNSHQEIEYHSIESESTSSINYNGACALDEGTNHFYPNSNQGFRAYFTALTDYQSHNSLLLEDILAHSSGFRQMKTYFQDDFINNLEEPINLIKTLIADPFWAVFGELVNDTTNYTGVEEAEKVDLLGWVNCSFLGQDYNMTMNTIKETLVPDLQVVTYCSLIFEILIIALYFIIISLANNIRDKESEKQENGYDVESIKEDGEIFEIIENNKYKQKYEAEGELITINRIKSKPKKANRVTTTESNVTFNIRTDKTQDITKEEDINSIKKKLPDNIVQVPKFDIAENIEAIKNVDVRKLIDKNGRAVMHPIRISINSPMGVMEASDKYAHLYNYDVFEPLKEDNLGDDESDIENGSYYQKSGKKSNKGKSSQKLGKVKKGKGKGKKKKKDTDKESSSDF